MRYLAAFRTHVWDDEIAELARRFFAALPTSRQVVLVDESHGPVAVPGYEKISHTDNTESLGLPNYPTGQSLWFNGDYAVYFLQRAFPDFDYYVLSESDLAVNLSLEQMMRSVSENSVDLVAHRIERSTPDWFWHRHGLTVSDAPWRALVFFMVLSRRAIACLFEERQQLARRFAAREIEPWPFCEAFVPSVLKSTSGMKFAEVGAFADVENLRFRPWLSLHDPRASRPGSLVHPVLGGKRFIARLLARHLPRDVFIEGSDLRQGLLSQTPFENIVEPVRRALSKERDHAGVALLYEEAAAQGWTAGPLSDDLAFCKPALTSSVSPWSHYQDRERDACGANGEELPYDYGFHTDQETDPWWMVDLLAEQMIDEVTIVNRSAQRQRFRTFRIETSLDGSVWTTRFTQAEPADISPDPEWPWRVHFPEPFPARYVRIVLSGAGILHLRRVQVFGPSSLVSGQRFIGRLLAKYPARDFLREGSELRRELLSQMTFDKIVEPVRRALARERDHAGVVSLYEQAAAQGWRVGPLSDDLAFCKPALTSSVSRWSHYQDRERDACGANSEELPLDYGFHTEQETDPWWMVDLLGEQLIEEVAIVNRPAQRQRFRTFRIETSLDGSAWTTRFTQAQPADISPDPEWPWRAHFQEPFAARYVRIVLLGAGILHLRRVQVFGPGSLVSGKRFVGKLLAKYPLRDFFHEGSELRRELLSQAPFENIVEPVRRALARERDHAGLALLYEEAAAQGWTVGPKSNDLAFCKPALTSSVSRWSHYQDRERDACGANGEELPYDYGFHTDQETDPWWMVDLLTEQMIDEVTIVNRSAQRQRFRTFRIETSLNGSVWTTRFTQAEPADISPDPERPWRVHFPEPFPARYVRIVLLGVGILHLRRVQVFGRALYRAR
jgi:F5/8 type C domain